MPLHSALTLAAPGESRSDFLRLRTLILLRWAAIAGQTVALAAAEYHYGIRLPFGLCYLVVGVSVIANLVSVFLFPGNVRLSERAVFLTLAFDLAQLGLLLFLTGGMTNPFALLILAPVTISATALGARATMLLGAGAIVIVTLLALVNLPMRLADGTPFGVPSLFGFGYWLAIVIGIVFLGSYAHRVASEILSMQDALLATQMALARAQKLTDLGGVVAAAAHELGTPLATIKLVSAELIEELDSQPDLQADAQLIRDQADRCRDILRSMGQAGKDDRLMRQAPLSALLREAADPHLDRGKAVAFALRASAGGGREPIVLREPEVLHGLRNLIQNAVDFARSQVWIEAEWTADRLLLRIIDDGAGYPPQVLGRIGDPFMRNRRTPDPQRPEYEGMGLGLFIAKTLLERTGAELSFANGGAGEPGSRSGAIVEVIWPLPRILAAQGALGENAPNL